MQHELKFTHYLGYLKNDLVLRFPTAVIGSVIFSVLHLPGRAFSVVLSWRASRRALNDRQVI